MNKVFMAGAAKADITPAVGTLLFGYNPDTVSTSVHDPLNVTALAVSDGDKTALLLSATVGEIKTSLCDEIRSKIGIECGISSDNVILCATHTHSAPNTCGMEGWGDVDRPYCDEIFIPSCVKASKEAISKLCPAKIGEAVVNSQVAINRRQLEKNGGILLGQNPWGIYDPKMTVLAIVSESGTGILNLVHYGCHGTSAGNNHEISRDWSGMMIDRLEAESGVLSTYFNGAVGDTGPRLTNGATVGNIKYTEELGSIAASDAVKAYKSIHTYSTDFPLEIHTGNITLPYKSLPTLSEVNEALSSYKEPKKLINIERLTYEHLVDVKEALENNIATSDALILCQTVVHFGNIAFVPFPFEMFSEIAIRMSAYSGIEYTLSLSNANGAYSYLPSEDQICRGGYEIACFTTANLRNLRNDTDTTIINENLRLLRGE